MAVIDVDNGHSVDSLIQLIHGYTYLIHSSFSHTKDMPKYRVVLPLSQTIDAAEWPLAWSRINSWLGGINDPATKDASRLYYMPVCPLDSQDPFVSTGIGKLLDVSYLPELSTELKKEHKQSTEWNKSIQIEGIEPIPPDALGSKAQLTAMQQNCSFIQWTAKPEIQPIVSEPLWMAMLSNQCRFEGGTEAAHEASCQHPEYDENTTDRKLERCLAGSAPITCNRIKELGFTGCPSGGCKLPSGITTKSPAGLGAWANKQVKSDENGEEEDDDGRRGSAIPSDLNKYLNHYHSTGLVYVSGSFYGYQDGYWPRLDELVDIRKTILFYLGTLAENKEIANLLRLTKDYCAAKAQDVAPNLNLICLQNGTLDLEKGELIDFSPDHHLTYKSDISWDANAKCERWLQFLDEIFANDTDKLEKIAFLKTWFGYCLIPDNSQHKFVWMVGAGGNGKSLLLSILTKLIGSVNVSNAHIERLDDKYVRAELEGKLINISSEMSADATLADGYLKSIVSGDMVEAERKYQPSFSFKPFVKLIGATNHLPRLLDLTDGFFRRAIVLSFNRQFLGADCDPYLENKLTNELPGILTWAVEGLKELKSAGKFAIPPSSIAALTQYKAESDPTGMFAAECLATVDAGGLLPSEVYRGYRDWCSKSGFSAMNKVRFGKRLVELGFTKRRSGGKDYWLVDPIEGNGSVWWSETVPASNVVPIIQTETARKFGL
jgi:putative DNA primase/helicase